MDRQTLLSDRPIPPLKSVEGWKTVPIHESGEKLVALPQDEGERIFVEPKYYLRGVPTASRTLYLREGVARRLVDASRFLPTGYALIVWDAWRPISVQRALFDEQLRAVRYRLSLAEEEDIRRETETYVSHPSNDELRPSPHYTGGAVDLGLADDCGRPYFAGTDFDVFDARSRTRAFEEIFASGVAISMMERNALQNRRILFHAMSAAGFVNYREEWWHFDYGNQFWGSVMSSPAIYGGVEVLHQHIH